MTANDFRQKIVNVADKFVGEIEKTPNSSPTIDIIQKSFKYYKLPYCAIFALYCYKIATIECGLKYSGIITASSQELFEWALKNKLVYVPINNLGAIKQGDIIIWRKAKLWQGHVGIIESMDIAKESANTIEGNTFSGEGGDQSQGDGIFRRKRTIKKVDFVQDAFYLRGFINAELFFNLMKDGAKI